MSTFCSMGQNDEKLLTFNVRSQSGWRSLNNSATYAGRFSGNVAEAVPLVLLRSDLVSSELAILSGSTTCEAGCDARLPSSVAWRWLGAGFEVGADDAVDERSRVSA